MALDLDYVDEWSPALDLKILLRTISVVLRGFTWTPRRAATSATAMRLDHRSQDVTV